MVVVEALEVLPALSKRLFFGDKKSLKNYLLQSRNPTCWRVLVVVSLGFLDENPHMTKSSTWPRPKSIKEAAKLKKDRAPKPSRAGCFSCFGFRRPMGRGFGGFLQCLMMFYIVCVCFSWYI